MIVKHVQVEGGALSGPDAAAWASVPAETIGLAATPLESQPTRHIRKNLEGKQWGACKSVQVQAAHDGSRVYFRLQWEDASENRIHEEASFPDAAALLFPMNGEAALQTMGSRDHPVNAWFWRPDIEGSPENLVARGLGTIERQDSDGLETKSARVDGGWTVVLARPLSNGATQAGVRLEPGAKTSVAVAVWEGSAGERAGIKAFSQTWRDLELER